VRWTDVDAGAAVAGESTVAPALYLVLEGDRPLAGSGYHCLVGVREVDFGRGPERSVRRDGGRLELRVADRWLSGQHARLVRTDGGWEVHDSGSRNGTFVNGAQAKRTAIEDGDVLEIGHSFWLWRAAAPVAAGSALDLHAARGAIDGAGDLLAPEDLGLIIGEVLRAVAGARAGELTFAALAARSLLLHDWRRGTGELRACLDAAVVLAGSGTEIEREHLPIARPPAQPPPLQEAPSERDRIAEALRAAGGNQTRAARKLGISRTTLGRRMKQLGVVHPPRRK
jgi:hypothetical protein